MSAPALLALSVLLWATVAEATTREIGPEANFCAEVNALTPGRELVLRPGDYRGPCTISTGGTLETPIVVRAKDLTTRPRLVYTGTRDNVLNIEASDVTLRGLVFGPTAEGVDGVKIKRGDRVLIEECLFDRVGGISISANATSSQGITVRRNEFANPRTTALYFGCHDGIHCAATGLLIEGNYIHSVDAREDEIGYGLQVKLNSTAIIRDNVIVDTKGPGIMVYGSTELTRASLIERNAVFGSRTSGAIVVGGGPAIIRNNLAAGSREGGIWILDYRRRGLLRGIQVLHNTVYNNTRGGIVPTNLRGDHEVLLMNNAVHAPPGILAIPPAFHASHFGNVACVQASCFVQPEHRDFSPSAGSPLLSYGRMADGISMPKDDFFGIPRGVRPTVGAFEKGAGVVSLGFKPAITPNH